MTVVFLEMQKTGKLNVTSTKIIFTACQYYTDQV